MAALEEERRAGAAGVGDPVAIRRAADEAAADDRNLLLPLERSSAGWMTVELQAEPARQLGARQLAREMQRLQRELQDEVERRCRLLERLSGGRKRHDVREQSRSDRGHKIPIVQELPSRVGGGRRAEPRRGSARPVRARY